MSSRQTIDVGWDTLSHSTAHAAPFGEARIELSGSLAMTQQPNDLLLASFTAAWAAKDVERIGALLTNDIVFGASVGPEPGATFNGRNETLAAMRRILADEVGCWHIDDIVISGDMAFVEWRLEGGFEVESTAVRGIDVFEFRGGLIARKDAFRKVAGEHPPTNQTVHSPDKPVPYAPRHYRSLGLWHAGDFAVKAYLVQHRLDTPDSEVRELIGATQGKLDLLVKQADIEGEHFNLGVAILHQSRTGNFVLLLWWAHDNIYCQLLFISDLETTGKLERLTGPITACVWEAVVISHERDAWVRTMLQDDPSPADYLSALLPDGLY
jgi:ketosteroid isomerase-like protein